MNKNLAKNKGTKKYRGGSKGKANLSKRIRIPEKKEALTDKTIYDAIGNWDKGGDSRRVIEDRYGNISDWDVSQVTNMSRLFMYKVSFNESIENWDVSNVENMSSMFFYAESFNQPLEKWNVSKVKDMFNIFSNAEQFNQPIEKWNVSNVKHMSDMFSYAKKFNQPLEKWNVSKVEDMSSMFKNAKEFNQPIEKWNVSKVKDMSSMFENAENYEVKYLIPLLNNLDYKIIKSLLNKEQYNNFLKEIAKNKINKKFEIDHNVDQKGLADRITSYLGGRRKTKKRNTNKKRNKTRSKK